MHLITREESETVKTLTVSLRMKSKDRIIDHFRSAYRANPDDMDAVLNYGLCMSTYAITNPSNAKQTAKRYITANKALSRVLKKDPTHWLARYLRSLGLHGVEVSFFQMAHSVDAPKYMQTTPEDDIRLLIEQQSRLERQEPYFLCSYMLQAYFFIHKNKMIDAVESFDKGMKAFTGMPTSHEPLFLIHPFYKLSVAFKNCAMEDEAKEVEKACKLLFP